MTRIMFDSINVDAIPSDATAVAGYVGGHWPTFHQLGRFKHANRLSIAVTAAEDAACLDCEPGDVPPAAVGEIADWLRRQRGRGEARPVIYASRDNLPGIITGLHDAHGIAREKYRVWSAHYGVGAHICSGVSCGAAFTADATQWTDKALGRNLDESLLSDTFFPESPRHHRRLPALHKPRVRIHPKVKGSTAGAALVAAITAVLRAAHVHVTPDESAAVAALAALLAGYITPRGKVSP